MKASIAVLLVVLCALFMDTSAGRGKRHDKSKLGASKGNEYSASSESSQSSTSNESSESSESSDSTFSPPDLTTSPTAEPTAAPTSPPAESTTSSSTSIAPLMQAPLMQLLQMEA